MSLCSVLIGHRGSVKKVRNVDKNLCVAANLRPVLGRRRKIKRFNAVAALLRNARAQPHAVRTRGKCQAVSTFRASFVLLSGFTLRELLNKNPPPQWKCSLTK